MKVIAVVLLTCCHSIPRKGNLRSSRTHSFHSSCLPRSMSMLHETLSTQVVPNVHKHTRTHTYSHTCKHTYTHARTHTHTHACMHTHTHTHTHNVHTRIQVHTHTHTYTHHMCTTHNFVATIIHDMAISRQQNLTQLVYIIMCIKQ